MKFHKIFFLLFCFLTTVAHTQRSKTDFNKDWKFYLGDDSIARYSSYDDASWRKLSLPHDWSIEGEFSEKHPTTSNQGALPAGIGWYRKTFSIAQAERGKKFYIIFDGIYRNSEVWINGHYLGKRPNGYVSFRYDLSPHLKFGAEKNVIAVKVDNSLQPNSRWYTGSGIYRNVWLLTTNQIALSEANVFITTGNITSKKASVYINSTLMDHAGKMKSINLVFQLFDDKGKLVSTKHASGSKNFSSVSGQNDSLIISNPKLWSVSNPHLYKAVIKVYQEKKLMDQFETNFGIRYFNFDPLKGFSLNGKALKIQGVCNHHDLGALGAAVNKRAIERQLQILKKMGCNAIRTAHNPPAPELLDLCDKMGFLVMDEAFDMWKKRKNRFDYNVDFDEWFKKDLADMVIRDRNHPSVFMWSIGNEIREQFDSSGIRLTKEMADIVRALDPTRPVTCALTENIPEKNFIYQSGALDVLGFNYKLDAYADLPVRFPGEKFIAAETASALATRSHYDMPSDSARKWPPDSKPFTSGNPDHTVSAYDHVYAYWGASHEQSWSAVKKYDHMAGCFVWSGFDFLGEPVPYQWPSRSSYYGIIDLAGFPKDVYYFYQSEWTNDPVLHIFPHWNWAAAKEIDVWSYYNNADEVELYLNGRTLGKRKKQNDSMHVMWRVKYEPGTLRAISRKKGKIVLSKEIQTAGKPFAIQLVADRRSLKADGKDLSFVTVKVVDEKGNIVPYADDLIHFRITGAASIAGVDNGNPVSHESFKATERKAFHGLCLAIVQAMEKKGNVIVEASANGLRSASINLQVQ